MFLLHSFLSFSAVTLFLLHAAFALRADFGSLRSRLLGLLALSVSANLIWQLPEPFSMPEWLRQSLRFLAIPNMALMWSFVRALLKDDYRVDARELVVIFALCLFPGLYWLQANLVTWPWIDTMSRFGAIPALVAIVFLTISIVRDFFDDLVERRRRVRLWIVAAIVCGSLFSLLSEDVQNREFAQLIQSASALICVSLASRWLLIFQPHHLFFQEPNAAIDFEKISDADESPSTSGEENAARTLKSVDPKDLGTLRRLQLMMAEQRLYLQPDLSVGSLAKQLSVPEHQLRALINKGLGYRNFSQYLLEFRLQHAKTLLTDPNLARKQILAIAMDSGFASLATFNRAFKVEIGITPSDFRNQALHAALHQ